MNPSDPFLSPSEAAAKLGISTKALRLYEERGLIRPARTAAGWRAYSPTVVRRAAEIAELRSLGLTLREIGAALDKGADGIQRALAAHQARLETALDDAAVRLQRVRSLRSPPAGAGISVAFDLPWPWGGERFEFRPAGPLTWITGPLFSGKTQLAQRIADAVPGGIFLPAERSDDTASGCVDDTLGLLCAEGASRSAALRALIMAMETERRGPLVIDMIEDGLDEATQRVLAAHLRRRGRPKQPLFCLTRSSAMLDLERAGRDEMILYCPANHSPPIHVPPCPGAEGYEAVRTCLASPAVRARSAGVVATRLDAA